MKRYMGENMKNKLKNLKTMSRGAEWAKNYLNSNKKRAMKVTKNITCSRKGKKFKIIKICDAPPTWKEIEILE